MSKESTAAVYATTPTITVAESDCGSVGILDHKSDASARCVIEHINVKKQ
ncbi:hypothetical protein Plhal304r1_c039g0117261 [Plasmopara halstedii]